MRYVIVDLDGASRDYFDTQDAVGNALREAESDAAGAAADLYVVAYAGDQMALDPVRGDEWLNGWITSPPDDGAEFQRFAELAGKLIQVPKVELDEKRQR